MFGARTGRGPWSLVVAAIAGIGLAIVLCAAPARAEVDLSIAIPGPTYYTPPPAFSYDRDRWWQPIVGGVYLGFGHYHHHYW